MFKWMTKTQENATLGDAFMYVISFYGVIFGVWTAIEHKDEIKEFVKGGVEKVKEKKLKLTKK